VQGKAMWREVPTLQAKRPSALPDFPRQRCWWTISLVFGARIGRHRHAEIAALIRSRTSSRNQHTAAGNGLGAKSGGNPSPMRRPALHNKKNQGAAGNHSSLPASSVEFRGGRLPRGKYGFFFLGRHGRSLPASERQMESRPGAMWKIGRRETERRGANGPWAFCAPPVVRC